MRNLWKITKNILYRIAKKKSSILVHVILPAAVILGISMLFTFSADGVFNAAVVDLSQSESSEYLLEEIEATGKFEIMDIEESNAEKYITEGVSGFVLIIPEDFEDSLLSGDTPHVKMMSLKNSEGAAWMQGALNMQIGNLKDAAYGAEYQAGVYYGIIDNLSDSVLKFESELVDDYSGDIYATQPLIGMYLMLVLLSASTISFMILDEKRRGTFARIGTAPVSPRSYTLANILSNMIVLTIQLIFVLVLIRYVVKINFHTTYLELFIILFLYLLCGVGLGVLIASATNKMSRATAIFYLILTPSCMISGCFWPIEFMPDILAKISVITPQRWAMDAVTAAQSGQSLLLPCMILLAYAALLFIASAYFVKYKEKR